MHILELIVPIFAIISLRVDSSDLWGQMENNNKGVQDNYIFGTYFGSDSFFIVSLPEKYLSGLFS